MHQIAAKLIALTVTAQEPATPAPSGGSPYAIWPMIIGMIAIMYFLIIRPQKKREKERRGMLNALKKDDRVVTIGGIIGTVTLVREKTVKVRVKDSDVELTLTRSAVSRVVTDDSDLEEQP